MNIQPRPLRSAIFAAYNLASASHLFEPGRLHRALGLAQRKETVLLGNTTVDTVDMPGDGPDGFRLVTVGRCDCEDYKLHGPKWKCKHRLCVMLIIKAKRLEAQ